MSGAGRTIAKVAAGAFALGAGCFAYGSLYEVDAYRLRRISVPVLPREAQPIRILHVADLHLTPKNRVRRDWVSLLAGLDPDLVINTGDNLAHPDAVPSVIDALGRLLDRPGVYVWGSNDYYAPTFKNPLAYLTQPDRQGQPRPEELPWRDLGRAFLDAGWIDLTGERVTVEVNGTRLGFRGTDDAHLRRDQYVLVAGSVDRAETDVAIGVTHAPYRRILDPMVADGMDLIVAGHTHGGQVCVPFLRRPGHQLRSEHPAGEGSVAAQRRRQDLVPARLGRSWHLPVRALPLRLPTRSHPDDPGPRPVLTTVIDAGSVDVVR